MKRAVLSLTLLVLPFCLFAEEQKVPEQKTIQALRVNEPIKIDGILDEKIWQGKGYSDFVQSDPIDGGPPSEKTEVWVAYDDKALYVAAYLHDSEPKLIRSLLGRRDDYVDSDWFIFAVDPYFDNRTGYQFAVNPSGSIVDWTLSNDIESDRTWDGVWDWKAAIHDNGWIIEIRIPFNQLRFPKKNEYVWGANFRRVIKRKNESVGFVWIPKEDSAYVSRFARLEGIQEISLGRHIEVIPYSVGQAQFRPAEEGNPFETGQKFLGNVGFDLKASLKSNLTLDVTVNPDFGQVEVDPAVINLSAYETYYQEKRPFFIEGASLFNGFGTGGIFMNANINWPSPSFFYSRRIGRSPQGDVTHDGYVNFPDRTTILGAFKLTGKLGDGWNFGFINALTAREQATIDSSGERIEEEVEPFSYYGILRAQKEFGKGQHGLGVIATGVIRDLKNETLENILNKNAFSLAFDGWTFLDKKRAYVIGGWLGGTRIEGSQQDILRLQYSSLHYYQRPDATHIEVDENATFLTGWGGRLNFAKQQGRFIFTMAVGALSPGFNPNDMGFQFGSSDRINGHILLAYRWVKPGKLFREVMIYGGPFRNYDFGGNKTWDGFLISLEGTFLNYWGINTMVAYNPKTMSNNLTRGGPLALIPAGYQVDVGINSDNRKPIVLSAYSSYYRRPTEGYSWYGEIFLRWKPRSNISFSFGPEYSIEKSEIQWVTSVKDSLMTETFGRRYIFGHIDQHVLSSEVRLDWTFTPKLTLQMYLQPYLAVGKYERFRELAQPKSYEYTIYGENNSAITYEDGRYIVTPDLAGPEKTFSFSNPDFNFKSLRGTIVLRWEYLPGSLIYLVWTQNRADYSHPGDFQLRRDLNDLLTAPGDNIFLVKVSYRWNL
ncbi:MAG: DUF5916 domain-containing protein [Candidatus Aminicenantales bacterium]